MEINQTKREKFMEYAGKRVNNVLHDMQILEPMARSASYDFTRQDVEEMFDAMQETLNNVKAEFEKKFEEKARSEKKVFTFGRSAIVEPEATVVTTITTTASETLEDVSTLSVETTIATKVLEEAQNDVESVIEGAAITEELETDTVTTTSILASESTTASDEAIEDTF